MQMIADGKIKEGTRINIINNGNSYKFYTIVGVYRCLRIWREEIGKEDTLLERVLDTEDLLTETFEILEDKTEEIEECVIRHYNTPVEKEKYIEEKMNEIIKAVNIIKKTFTVDTSKETNCMTD